MNWYEFYLPPKFHTKTPFGMNHFFSKLLISFSDILDTHIL